MPCLGVPPALARVVSIEVISRQPVLNGQAFGSAGAYEEITARVLFAVRADDPHNAGIVDLDKAPRNAQGEVEFSSDLFLLRPVSGGNGAMLLEIPNRGGKGILRIVDGGTAAILPEKESDFGDAWLLRQGYTVAALGWQWDVAPSAGNLRLYAPVATNNGQPITGLLRDDFAPAKATAEWPLGHIILGRTGGTEYPVANPDDPQNVLTVRDTPEGPRQVIPRAQWSFAKTVDGAIVPSDRSIHLDAGFAAGRIYELVYVVKDPVVAGLGFAAVRDFSSWVKHDPTAVARVQRVYALGISQCGRFLRDFLYEGFNQDEGGAMALDGVLAHVGGAGRGSFNYRFAQPSRDAQPTTSIDYPTDIFPFTDEPERDPSNPKAPPQGLLDRAKAEQDVPKIFLSHTSYEYWGRAASLIHTSADGKSDARIGPNVRIYYFTGLQHFSGPFPPMRGVGEIASQNLQSPLPVWWFWRAMIANMNAWVKDGVAPPESAVPHVADGTLVPLDRLAFPKIPGAQVPATNAQGWHYDFGPQWETRRILTIEPPRVGKPFPALVPQVDADGNERAGVRLPEETVPLATYTGWNLRAATTGAAGERTAFLGSDFPFAKTAGERAASGDPRPSIAERYTGRDDYLARYAKAVDGLVQARWILPEDAAAVNEHGAAEWEWATAGVSPTVH
ncbi:MAG TPA: alpha/beta hydrolase domain-containing protein [Acidobacteriaceae bacterium]|nr:alpha/beta hydrolase domain-containing protein [Acidobacteriaceae bacterium]